MSKGQDFTGFLHSENSEELMDNKAADKLHHYLILPGLHHSEKNLRKNSSADPDSKSYKKQMGHLRRQIFFHYLKNIFFFPIYLVKALTPSFFKGSPNIWTNIKMIAVKKEFQPLRMAMISWLVFTYLIIQGGIFFFHRDLMTAEAASFTWTQTGWTASSSAEAVHATDRTGWTNYWDIYPTNIVTTTGSELTLATEASSTVQTTNNDFDQGTFSNAETVSGGVKLSSDSAVASAFQKTGYNFSCALKKGGTVYCWGDNLAGSLGNNNSPTDSDTPVQVLGVGGSGYLTGITYIGGGGFASHICAVNTSDNAYCWGKNDYGQLGDNNGPTNSGTPVEVLGVGGTGYLGSVSTTAALTYTSCALITDGSVYCWGEAQALGVNSWDDSPTPVQVHGVGDVGYLANIVQIVAGSNHICALSSSGNVYCWGRGNEGALGNNDTTTSLVPVEVHGVGDVGYLSNIIDIGTSSDSSCAVDSSNDLYCWGSNTNGQLGINNTTQQNVPVQVHGVGDSGTLANIVHVMGGYLRACAIDTSGDLYCWGDNGQGALGDGTEVEAHVPVQVVGVGGVGTFANAVGVSSGDTTSCAFDTSDNVYCWGNNDQGQLGDGSSPTDSDPPVQVVGVGGVGTLSLSTAYNSSGTFTSNILDTVSSTAWGAITWTTSTLANTSVTLKVRTGQQADMSDATAWGTCTAIDNTGDDISSNNCVTDGDRYIQYQAALATNNTSISPELQDVTINYTRYVDVEQTLTSSPFNTGDSTNVLSSIYWSETLPTSDTDIKFQIRTSADGTTWTSWLGPTGAGDYYTDSVGGETINSTHTDGTDDQYFQYKIYISSSDGGVTPTLSDVSVVYVINQEPQISGSGVTATQLSNGDISINWGVYDADTGTATTSFQYSLNNGDSWSNVLGHLSSGATTTRSISGWTTSTVVWSAREEIDGQDVVQAKIRVIEDDGELANNTASADSDAFTLDLADPSVETPAFKIVATTTPATLYHTVTDTNTIEMISGLQSDVSDGSWEAYATDSTISLSTDPETVYMQFRDSYFNTSTIYSATTPETPGNMVIKDISNAEISDYKEFIIWNTVDIPVPGFDRYDIYRSTNGVDYTLLSSQLTRTINYYLDDSVSGGTTYYYKVATVDSYGNTSPFSSVVSDNADGQGGTDVTAPTITSVASSGITTQGFTVTWDTDEVASSSVAYSVGVFGGSFATTTVDTMVNASGGSLGEHSVTVTGLTPNTDYYFQVASGDPNGNVVFDTNSGSGYNVTTLDGPVISGVAVDSADNTQATISWNTDVSSDSTVYYSVSSDLSGASSETSGTLTKNHSITITGLSQGTRYYFYVTSGAATDNNGMDYYSFTTTDDNTVPVISSVTASPVADTTAVITWVTNEGATTQMMYGTTSGALDNYSTLETGLNLNHTVSLTGLTANTTYYHTVSSVDGSGNAVTSSESSFVTRNTLTEATVDITDPVISSVSIDPVADTTALVTWTTDEISSSQVSYGATSGSYSTLTTVSTDLNTTHAVLLEGLTANTTYYLTVSSVDASGNATTSTESDFTTLEVLSEESAVVAREAVAEAAGRASAPGGGGGFPYTPTDNIAPVISNIRISNITSNSATVNWDTNEASDSIIQYGNATGELGVAVVNIDSNVTNHSLIIGDLSPSTQYVFVISSADESGNRVKSAEMNFTTLSGLEELDNIQDLTAGATGAQDSESVFKSLIDRTADLIRNLSGQVSVQTLESGLATQYSTIAELGRLVPLPLISGQPVVEVGSSYARIYWTTDKAANSLVGIAPDSTFQNNQEYVEVVGNASEQVTNHDVLISELRANTTYHYQVRSKTPVSDTAKSRDFTFTTKDEQAEIVTYKVDSVSDNEANFSWVTNIPTDSKITYIPYGSDGSLQIDSERSTYDKAVTTIHNLDVKDMEGGLIYQVEISGQDINGNIISKLISTFSTSEIDSPPLISQVQTDAALLPGDQTAVQAILSWVTNEPSTSQVFYQKGFGRTNETAELNQKTPLDPNYVKKHILVITNFDPGAVYQFQVESVDSSGNVTRSRTYTLLTPRQKESVFQVIMGNIEETFSWVGQLGL